MRNSEIFQVGLLAIVLSIGNAKSVEKRYNIGAIDDRCFKNGEALTTLPFQKPGACKEFYQCSNGYLYTMLCAPGTAFNAAIGVCDLRRNIAACSEDKPTETSTTESATTETGYTEIPTTESIPVDAVHYMIVVCQHSSKQVACPSGQKIRVLNGFYGRDDNSTCPGKVLTTHCSARKSLPVLKHVCGGKKTCYVASNNDEFGNPCAGTTKYVRMTYKCSPRNPNNLDEADDQLE